MAHRRSSLFQSLAPHSFSQFLGRHRTIAPICLQLHLLLSTSQSSRHLQTSHLPRSPAAPHHQIRKNPSTSLLNLLSSFSESNCPKCLLEQRLKLSGYLSKIFDKLPHCFPNHVSDAKLDTSAVPSPSQIARLLPTIESLYAEAKSSVRQYCKWSTWFRGFSLRADDSLTAFSRVDMK